MVCNSCPCVGHLFMDRRHMLVLKMQGVYNIKFETNINKVCYDVLKY